jgi:hypothetical protein
MFTLAGFGLIVFGPADPFAATNGKVEDAFWADAQLIMMSTHGIKRIKRLLRFEYSFLSDCWMLPGGLRVVPEIL